MKNIIHMTYRSLLASVLIAIGVFLSGGETFAASPTGYASRYGLVVHEQNKNEPVPKIKALQVLMHYFPGAVEEIVDFTDPKGPCVVDFIHCEGMFYPFKGITQREFLLWFEHLKLLSEDEDYDGSDEDLYRKAWLNARHQNWLPVSKLTYGSLQELLYRYAVSESHNEVAYYNGLVLDADEITSGNFPSLYALRDIQNRSFEHLTELKSIKKPNRVQASLTTKVSGYYEAFKELESELIELKHPFSVIPGIPDDIRQRILDNDLNEVLSSVDYDYSSNISNRKYNLVHGAFSLHGKVYQPGDIIDFTNELASQGWWSYKFGWVIYGGVEKWQFGGGLCGSATMAFAPSWLSGMEVVQRYPHSAYYRNLYPTDRIGLDATIYRGSKNLILKNNMDSPIMYYVVDDPENEVITTYVIGNSPYYKIDIEGPIYLGKNTYKWVRRMEQFDGTIVEDDLVTRYGAIY